MQLRAGKQLWILVVLATIATITVVVARPVTVEAVTWAPTSPPPNCVVSGTGTLGLGCPPTSGTLGATVGGRFGAGQTFTINTSPNGLAPCLHYKSTGCYYALNAPTLTRCVYLANNDPNDVRSCGTLSTQGAVTATPTGTCSGALGSTYAYGGPATQPPTWWAARAPQYARCTFSVPNTRPVDNLLGPTFYLVGTSVRECMPPVPNNGCDEAGAVLVTRTEFAWLPVEGTLAPHAAFLEEPLEPGLYKMRNLSEPFATGTTTWEWSFGDGTTSTARDPLHRYALPGSYTVTLTMRNSSNATRTASRVVKVKAPTLQVALYNPDAEYGEGETGNRFSIDQTFTARLVVSTDEGLGQLTGVHPIGDIIAVPPQLEVVGVLPVVSAFALGSEGLRQYDITLKAVAPGPYTIATQWTAIDPLGATVGPVSAGLGGSVAGLDVDVVVDPPTFSVGKDNNDDGEITPEDDEVTVKVTVTNTSKDTITGIVYDELSLSSNVLDDPAVALEPLDAPTRPFNDLPKEQSDTLEWTFRATDAVDALAQILVRGQANGVTTTSNGEADIRAFTERLIEAQITLDDQLLQAGKVIKISGHFKNVTDEAEEPKTVSFAVNRVLTGLEGEPNGNGGNGYFSVPGTATPQGIEYFALEPGEEIDLDAIVLTTESDKPSGFAVEYEVMPYVPDEDDPTLFVPGDQRNVEIKEEDGSSARHAVQLAPVAPTPEPTNWIDCSPDVLASAYLGCKFARGVETAARGLWQIGAFGVQAYVAIIQTEAYLLRRAFAVLTADAATRKVLVDEIYADLLKMKAMGHEALQGISAASLLTMVGDGVGRTIQRVEALLRTGDIELIAGELAELAGENVDMVLEALVAARAVVKTTLAVGGRAGLLRTGLRDQLEHTADEAIAAADNVLATQGERALPESRVLPAGVDVTNLPRLFKAWGVSEDDIQALFKIAEDMGVTIVFRSRSPRSIELIESGRALPKPQGVKTKGVSDLDMQFFGYPEEMDSIVAVVEPPLPVHPKDSPERAAAIDQYLASNAELQKIGAGPEKTDLENALRARLETRLDEWTDFEKDRLQWTRDPSVSNGGIKVDFDPAFNDLGRRMIEPEPNVRGRLVESTLPDGRKSYRVQMEDAPGTPLGADGTRFRDITGDIDFLAILTPEGRVLGDTDDLLKRVTELEQRAKIYKLMQGLLGMQHGESFTILNPKIRAKYLKDGLNAPGGETLLAATPQRRLMTTYFDEGLSTLESGANGKLVDGYQRVFFESLLGEAISPSRALNLLTLAELTRFHDAFRSITQYFGLSVFARLVGAAESAIDAEFDRAGDALQPGPDGGVEGYTPPPPGGRFAATAVEYPTGTAGGAWKPVDLAQLLAGGSIGLRPWTYVDGNLASGSTEAPALPFAELGVPATSPYFEIGDTVVLDPGGADEELAVLTSVTPMRFATPIHNDHEWGTMVLLAYADESTVVPAGASLKSVVPARLLETRVGEAERTVDGAFQGVGRVGAGATVELLVAGRGGVPGDAEAVMLNVTAVGPSGGGFVTAWPCGVDRPLASNLNFGPGVVVPNAVLAKVGVGGKVCLFSLVDTDLLVDVNGYVPAGASLKSVVPARLLETRVGEAERTVDGAFQGVGRVGAGATVELLVAGRGGVPGDAEAVMLNVTAVGPSGGGFVTAWPCGVDRPLASNLNFGPGVVVPNAVLAKVGVGGKVCLFSLVDTDLLVDVNGYVPAGASLKSVVPARLLETRVGEAERTVDGAFQGVGRVGAGATVELLVAGRGGVPGDAEAVMLNVTAVGPSGGGFVTAWPCGVDRPLASNLNFGPGVVVPNAVLAKVGVGGKVCLFSLVDTDLLVDVNGYVAV